jgi:NAD(P)-dependent dehydrogenase (short-subunit alcohol dehydrogenase family)
MVPPYRAAKGALVSLTQEMALACSKDGINVNAIALVSLLQTYRHAPRTLSFRQPVRINSFGEWKLQKI